MPVHEIPDCADGSIRMSPLVSYFHHHDSELPKRGADPRARRMGAGLPADIRRAQSGQVPCSDALARQGKVLDEVSAAIHADASRRERSASAAASFKLIISKNA